MDNNKTVGICTMEKFDNRQFNSVGSSRIRVRWLLPYWPEAEEYVIGKSYEVLIFQKVYWKKMMQDFKGIKILDLCDPDWLENKPVFEFIDLADAVTTSTEALAEYIRKVRPNALVRCIPDRVYMPEATPIKTVHNDELKKVVWFGYHQNAHYLVQTYDELIKQNVELTIVCEQAIEPGMGYRGKLAVNNVPFNYPTLNKELIKADAILLPDPVGDERAKYKSNNKTLQGWALAMPVVKTADDLERLLSKEARETEGKRNRKEVEDKWDVKYSVKNYKDLFEEIRAKKR